MADKKITKTSKHSKRCTDREMEEYAEVLTDPENNFALSLEGLAL